MKMNKCVLEGCDGWDQRAIAATVRKNSPVVAETTGSKIADWDRSLSRYKRLE